jgi:hypothetical protein
LVWNRDFNQGTRLKPNGSPKAYNVYMCRAYCINRNRCTHFTFKNGKCHLKTSKGPKTRKTTGVVSGDCTKKLVRGNLNSNPFQCTGCTLLSMHQSDYALHWL